jgi:hypothetical protein
VFEKYSVISFLLRFQGVEFSAFGLEDMSNGSVLLGNGGLHAYLIAGKGRYYVLLRSCLVEYLNEGWDDCDV